MIGQEETKTVGLLGYPVEHSLSPAMQNAAFHAKGLDWVYKLYPVAPGELAGAVEACVKARYAGWNVTVPHKERVVPFLDEASAEVQATGACNTVLVKSGGRLAGYNTDIEGFLSGLDEAGGISARSETVVLGAGGAARAVVWALATRGHRVCVLSRRPEQAGALALSITTLSGAAISSGPANAVELKSALAGAALCVNCTPTGMWPRIGESPLPEDLLLKRDVLVYDLVYRPRPTKLLGQATAVGCRTQDGLAMLIYQGAAAFRIWTGIEAPVSVMKQACLGALQTPTD